MEEKKYYQVSPMILWGNWNGICYAIETQGFCETEHNEYVEESIDNIKNEFDIYPATFKVVRRELAYINEEIENFEHYITIVQFWIMNSY